MSERAVPNATTTPDTVYWAAEKDLQRLASHMGQRIDRYVDACKESGRADRWRKSLRLAYGRDNAGRSSAMVSFGGEQGETVEIIPNLFRSFQRSIHVLVTGSRPSMSARTIASDAQATEDVVIANALVDYYFGKGGAEESCIEAAWLAPLMGDAWIDVRWDMYATPRLLVEADGNEGDGDLVFNVLRADQVMRDPDAPTMESMQWVIIAQRMHRWDLVERFTQEEQEVPEHPGEFVVPEGMPSIDVAVMRDEHAQKVRYIAATEAQNAKIREQNDRIRQAILSATDNDKWNLVEDALFSARKSKGADSDYVMTYELFHVPSLSVPQGRYAMMVGDTIVSERDNPYGELPCYPMQPSSEPYGPMGHGDAWDLLAPQDALTAVFSQLVTIQENFGMQNIWIPTGGQSAGPAGKAPEQFPIRPQMLARGMRAIRSPMAPQPINLVGQGAQNAMEAMETISGIMQRLTGLNDAALGDASKSQSGAALAMLHSLSLQYNSGLQRAYAMLLEVVATAIIKRMRQFASEERMVEISGRLKATTVKRFKATNLANIRGIDVEMGSAIMRTSAGRKEIADKLVTIFPPGTPGAINPEQYMEVQSTGRLEPIFDRPQSQRILVETENQALKEGRPVRAMVTDDHALHIAEHTVCLNDPDIRLNDQLAQAAMMHLQEHAMLWQGATATMPALLAATGQQPAPMPAMPAMPPGGPGMQAPGADPMAGAEGQPNPDGGPAPEPLPQGQPPIPNDPAMAAQGPDMPQMPEAPPPAL